MPSPSHSSASPSPLQHQNYDNPHHYYSSIVHKNTLPEENLHPSQIITNDHRKLLLGGIPPDADLAQVQQAITDPDYSGWMHVKKQGQLGWRKRFVCLKDSHLFLFKSDEVCLFCYCPCSLIHDRLIIFLKVRPIDGDCHTR